MLTVTDYINKTIAQNQCYAVTIKPIAKKLNVKKIKLTKAMLTHVQAEVSRPPLMHTATTTY